MPISIAENIKWQDFTYQFEDKFFDISIVDPPYFKNVGKLGYFGEKVSNTGIKRGEYEIPKWNEEIPDINYLNELKRISKHQIIWGINYYNFFHCVGRIVWDKQNDSSSFSKCEIASCTFHDSVQIFRFMWNGMLQGNMQNKQQRIHPTEKPYQLYYWLLKTYSKQGDKIFDSHLGSGSHRIAAYKLGIDFWSTECDTEIFEAQEKRFKEAIAMPLFDEPKILEQTKIKF